MPTWGSILKELQVTGEQLKRAPFDDVRRKYLTLLHSHVNRNVILYASKFTQPDPNASPDLITISEEDVQGLMEVVHGLSGDAVDLILHSPGGSPESAEAFVTYLRSKFGHVRVIVPHLAMSAATMISCSADVIVMGKHSFLGPIDPQFVMNTQLGVRSVPAQAILEQFDRAVAECADPSRLPAWLPILGQYGPELLQQCEAFTELARTMVEEWLKRYMLKDDPDRDVRSSEIASWLASRQNFKSHSKHIPRGIAESKGLAIQHLEDDETTQDLVLSVFHSATHTFAGTPAVKIIENHLGKAFIKQNQVFPLTPGPVPGGVPGQLIRMGPITQR